MRLYSADITGSLVVSGSLIVTGSTAANPTIINPGGDDLEGKVFIVTGSSAITRDLTVGDDFTVKDETKLEKEVKIGYQSGETNYGVEYQLNVTASQGSPYSANFDGDVLITGSLVDKDNATGTAGQVLSSTGTQLQWVVNDGAGITGTGTVGNIPKFTASTVLGNSIIAEAASAITVSGAATFNSSVSDQVILTGGASLNTRLKINRGTDDTNQNLLLGYNKIIVTRLDAPLASPQTDFTIQQQGSDGTRTPFTISSGGDATFSGNVDIIKTTSDAAGELRIGGILASDNLPFGIINFANTAAANSQVNDILAYIAGEKTGSSNTADLTFATSNNAAPTEKMRISSTGLTQINSTSTTALELITNQSASSLRLKNTGSIVADWIMQSGGITAGDLAFYNLDTSAYRLTITSGGNVGIGTSTIESYWSGYTALKVGYNNSIFGNTADSVGSAFFISQNLYNDGGNYRYVGSGSDEGGLIDLRGGAFVFSNAPLGTAGNVASIVPRLTISSGGDVEINNLIKFVDPTAGSAGTPQFKTLISYQHSTINSLSTIKGGNEASGTNGTYLKFSVNSSAAVNTPIDILTLKSAFVGGTTAQFDALIKANNGISFPNQSAGSGTVSSSTLDAYEEGTWTPTNQGTSNITVGPTAYEGTYTRIGNRVFVEFKISGITAPYTGALIYIVLAGFPYVQASNSIVSNGIVTNYPNSRQAGGVQNNSSGDNNNWFVYWENTVSNQSNQAIFGSLTYFTS